LLSGGVGTANTPSTEIFVNPYRYVDKSNFVQWFEGAQVDVAASIPTDGNHRYLAIFLKDDNTLETTTSTTKDVSIPLVEADKQECFDARSVNTVPVALWRLHDGQTNITNSDRIEDLRPWLPSPDSTAFNTPIALTTYTETPSRASEDAQHGGIVTLATAQPLDSVPTDIVVSKGIGKVMIVINAGGDVTGSITITGESIDRETGASTPADTDTITVDALSTDGSDTDSNGNTRHSFTGAYISSKWFTGSVTLSTADLTLTDVDVYHVSFEQFNDHPTYFLRTFDANILTTTVNAEFDAYLYSIEVAGDKCNVTREASLNVGADGETAIANRYWRLRRGDIDKELSGATDGIWLDAFYSNTPVDVEDVTIKVWADIEINGTGGGGGSTTFIGLSDTPASYSGQAGKIAAVNSGEDALEFISSGAANAHNPQGRLTLSTGDPVPKSDVTGAATLYYTPYWGNEITLYDTVAAAWETLTFAETSLSISGLTANTLYDIWGYNNSGTFALESLSWGTDAAYNITAATAADPCVITYSNTVQAFAVGNDVCIQGITGNINTKIHEVASVTAIATVIGGSSYSITVEIDTTGLTYASDGTVRLLDNTRVTAITTQNGIPVKTGDASRRYLGTLLIRGDGGECDDSKYRRYLGNYYNRENRFVQAPITTATSFTYTGAAGYNLFSVPNSAYEGFCRVSMVAPYNGTEIDTTLATAGQASASAKSTLLALQQNQITIAVGSDNVDSDGAFAQQTEQTGLFAKLYAQTENEGYNYIQMLMHGSPTANHTIWSGGTSFPEFDFGMRGFIKL
jgi:hypothetical protein